MREFVRCPLCGKLDDGGSFGREHRIEGMEQEFVGRGNGGFEWQHVGLDAEMLAELRDAAFEVYRRLCDELGEEP